MSSPDRTIEDWRERIDAVDRKLAELLTERARCAVEIGKIKRNRGMAVVDPGRERDVILNALAVNAGPLDNEALRRIFERIIEECRNAEGRQGAV
jgi:chorismate mutase